MRFKFVPQAKLPRLAWCARVGRGSDEVEVVHGPWVDTRPEGFFEGAWDGPFDEFGFADSTACMGTGARLAADRLVFVAPCHPFRWVVSLAHEESLWISNSIAFVLAAAGNAPDPGYLGYLDDLLQAYNAGITPAAPTLPTRDGASVQLHFYHDLDVGADLSIRRVEKAWPPAPRDFAEYRSMLIEALDRLRRNATDPGRVHSFRPTVLISRGYDSPACGALGARAGWKDALTLVPEGPGDNDDDGTPIAERLGLSMTRSPLHAWSRRDDAPEAEFLATGRENVMVRLAGLESELSGSIAIQGANGDTLWEPATSDLEARLSRPSNRTIGYPTTWEFELRAGIVFVYPASIGAVHFETIRRISRSEEMKPWSIRERYDRPIPRRILEEAGVPRDLFGVRKMASSHEKPALRASASGLADYSRFRRAFKVKTGRTPRNRAEVESLVYLWAMDRVMRRYRVADPAAASDGEADVERTIRIERTRAWEEKWSRPDFAPGWLVGEAMPETVSAVEEGWFSPEGPALDIGCGEGDTAAWLASRNIPSVGVDIAPAAIARCRAKHAEAAGRLEFLVVDLCKDSPPDRKYRILVDRGCFHAIHPLDRPAFVANLLRVSAPDARLILTMKGFRDGQPLGDPGEAERIRREVERSFGSSFRVLRSAPTWHDPFRGKDPGRALPGIAFWLERLSPSRESLGGAPE